MFLKPKERELKQNFMFIVEFCFFRLKVYQQQQEMC